MCWNALAALRMKLSASILGRANGYQYAHSTRDEGGHGKRVQAKVYSCRFASLNQSVVIPVAIISPHNAKNPKV